MPGTDYKYIRKCRECEEDFPTNSRNKIYCSEDCRQLSRKKTHKKYNRKRRKNIVLGTSRLNEHRLPDDDQEWRVVHKEYMRTLSFHRIREKNNDWKYNPQPFPDTLSILYEMEDSYPCPQCKRDIRVKDLKRCEVYCKYCGIVIYGPPHINIKYPETNSRMAATTYDVLVSESTKDIETGIKKSSVQDIAWERFYNTEKYNPKSHGHKKKER